MVEVNVELNEVFRKVFNNKKLNIDNTTTADDVEGWDSLSHMNLIFAVETKFKIRFTDREILSFKNVGDLIRSINNKIAN